MARVAVDIDGVLATGIFWDELANVWCIDRCEVLEPGKDLCLALRDAGHTVILHTARGAEKRKQTEKWLKENNIYYDGLVMGKFHADLYVDDKGVGWANFLTSSAEPYMLQAYVLTRLMPNP